MEKLQILDLDLPAKFDALYLLAFPAGVLLQKAAEIVWQVGLSSLQFLVRILSSYLGIPRNEGLAVHDLY